MTQEVPVALSWLCSLVCLHPNSRPSRCSFSILGSYYASCSVVPCSPLAQPSLPVHSHSECIIFDDIIVAVVDLFELLRSEVLLSSLRTLTEFLVLESLAVVAGAPLLCSISLSCTKSQLLALVRESGSVWFCPFKSSQLQRCALKFGAKRRAPTLFFGCAV